MWQNVTSIAFIIFANIIKLMKLIRARGIPVTRFHGMEE